MIIWFINKCVFLQGKNLIYSRPGDIIFCQMAQNPLILAVETSGRTGSIAIAVGEKVLAEASFSAPMRHSAEIFPAASNLLNRFGRKPEEIEHIYISVGPGSFTGLRIAVTLAKTMHLANDTVKIVAVDTLDVIAANIINLTTENTVRNSNHKRIATILDAKRSQFFIAVYQCNTKHSRWDKISTDGLMTASQFLDRFAGSTEPVWLLGEGLVYHKDKFKADGIRFLDEKYWTPRAEKVHLLGWKKARDNRFTDPLTLQPVYLRKPDVKEKGTKHKN